MKLELLSPAGNFETLKYVIDAGADAVYLGGKKFGARAFSNNFTNEELEKAIKLCHLYGVKVYITTNTIVYDTEVKEFMDYIKYIHELGVDAILLQDIGMLDLIHKTYPNLKLHASTQMNIHTVKEAKYLKELGFDRIVLARETNINVIKQIKKEVDIELEVFIHGALCVSESGQCLMSYMKNKRSANRGECAGCCRERYDLYKDNKKIDLKDEYLLSTKDLCLIEKIDELKEIGIDSLKIEGRMKSKEYAYSVTKAYRNKIDNKDYKQEKIDMFKMYNRGYTEGLIYNQNIHNGFRPNHMGYEIGKVIDIKNNKAKIKLTEELNQFDGIRFVGKKDYGLILNKIYKNNLLINHANINDVVEVDIKEKVYVGDVVYKTLDKKLIDKINNKKERKIPIDITFIQNKKDITLKIDNISLTKENVVEISKTNPVTKEIIKEKLSKLGNTPFILNKVDIKVDNNVFIPISIINNLRREIIDLLIKEKIKVKKIKVNKYIYKSKEYNEDFNYIFECQNKKQLEYIINNTNYLCYTDDKNLCNDKRILLKNKDIINSIGDIKKGLITDTNFNVTNIYSVNFLHNKGIKRITLSYEMDINKIRNLVEKYKEKYKIKPNLEVVIYGKPEVMTSKYCLLNTYVNQEKVCNVCKKGNYYLVDKFNNKYKIKKSNDCFMRILDYKNIDLLNQINQLKEIGINHLRITLDDESEKDIKELIEKLN